MPAYAGAESSEVPTQTHLELRGSYTKICGTCFLKRETPDTTAKVGLQLYGDYLPFGWGTRLGTVRVGPYASVSWLGQVEKLAGGLAANLRPHDASWEGFIQTGVRYTTDEMRYVRYGQPASQGQAAFNLAIGVRFYLENQWYVSLLGEHDSNGRMIGITIFPENGGYNPGVDSLMIGFGKSF